MEGAGMEQGQGGFVEGAPWVCLIYHDEHDMDAFENTGGRIAQSAAHPQAGQWGAGD